MLNNLFLGISKYSIATVIAVGSLISIDTFSQDSQYVEEVVTLGTRGKPRSVSDSPVPVDVLSSEDISKTGTDDLLMQLQGSVPSLNVHLQPISDAASMIRPGNLRGLSADATLIFTNGKRRHHASVIAFQGGGVNDGSQGADISVIPAIALKRIEVLREDKIDRGQQIICWSIIGFIDHDHNYDYLSVDFRLNNRFHEVL